MADEKKQKNQGSKSAVFELPSILDINPLAIAGFPALNVQFKPAPVKYSDIVDTSHFKPSAEKKRDLVASGDVGAGEKGLYDFEPGKAITKDMWLSETELLLRAGKLDKADVQTLLEQKRELVEESEQEAREKAELERANQAQKNREKALDQQLGVNQES